MKNKRVLKWGAFFSVIAVIAAILLGMYWSYFNDVLYFRTHSQTISALSLADSRSDFSFYRYSSEMLSAFGKAAACMLAVLLIVTLWVWLKRKNLKKISRAAGIFFLALLGVAALLHVTLYNNTETKVKYPFKGRTVLEYYLYWGDYHKNLSTGGGNISICTQNLFPDLFFGKDVTVAENAKDNPGVAEIIQYGEARLESSGLAPLSAEAMSFYLEANRTQVFHFYDAQETERTLHLATGNDWIHQNQLYVLDCEGSTLVIPASLVRSADLQTGEPAAEIQEGEKYAFTKFSLEFYHDPLIDSIWTEEGDYSPNIRALIYLLYVLLLGGIAAFPFIDRLGTGLYTALAFPLGASILILGLFLTGLLHIPIKTVSVILAPLLFSLAIGWGCWLVFAEKRKLSTQRVKAADILCICGTFAILAYACFNPTGVLTPDSFTSLGVSRVIAYRGELYSSMPSVTAYSFITILANVAAHFFGLDFAFSFQPALVLSGMLSLLLLQNLLLERLKTKQWIRSLINGLIVLPYILIPVYYTHIFALLNNLPTGIWLGIAVCLFLLYALEGWKGWLALSYLPFLLYCFGRVEGPIFATVLLVCFRKYAPDKKEYRNLVTLTAGLTACQYVVYFLLMNGRVDGVFWSAGKGAAMTALICALTVFLWLEPTKIGKWNAYKLLSSHLDAIMIAALLAGILCLLPIKSEQLLVNLLQTFNNLFLLGVWGIFWLVILLGIGCAFIFPMDPEKDMAYFCMKAMCSFFLVLMAIMLFRVTPLRTGSSDSGCRMMLHIAPLAGIFLSFLIAGLLDDRFPVENRPSSRGHHARKKRR